MKTKFLSVCTGITLVLFGASCFFYSINNVFAQPVQKVAKPIITEPSKSGKYQISMTALSNKNGIYLFAVVLNTETGVSEIYSYDTEAYPRSWNKSKEQLPPFNF